MEEPPRSLITPISTIRLHIVRLSPCALHYFDSMWTIKSDMTTTADAAIDATKSSGIRSFYAFTPIKRLKNWGPFEWDKKLLPAWKMLLPVWEMRQLEHLAKRQPFAGGRIKLAFGFDWYFLPRQAIIDVFERVRGLGIKLIKSHSFDTPIFGKTAQYLPLRPTTSH